MSAARYTRAARRHGYVRRHFAQGLGFGLQVLDFLLFAL
jgi:hypothetical protein